jgi:pyridoxamine 5'-phosphate oxidase
VDDHGFVFHTNYNMQGRELAEILRALCFHWPTLDEQIRIEGTVEPLPA